MIEMEDLQFEQAILRFYRETYHKTPSGLPKIFRTVEETRLWFWENFRVSNESFDDSFLRLLADSESWNRTYHVRLLGAPTNAYTKDNWVEFRGKKWVLWSLEGDWR